VPTKNASKPGGFFSVKGHPEYTYEPYMLVQRQRMTIFPVIPPVEQQPAGKTDDKFSSSE
jgi:hypothetical protein